ncbi:MAG TPA: flavin reductase family protein [Novosphingobium sp.]|nr:flavin reductase family protein [Novosphingobium sp.]HZV08448.1 flavin reductase family protein [Novosphingobium sp.]
MEELQARFRATMAHYPAGVVIVTTRDGHGRLQGFTATSFSSLSLAPPSILVCLAHAAFCYEAFVTSRHFAINFVGAGHDGLALRFARRGEDKFAGVPVRLTEQGVPLLCEAAATLECATDSHVVSGDHAILVGNVLDAAIAEGSDVLVHYQRRFGHVRFARAGGDPADHGAVR